MIYKGFTQENIYKAFYKLNQEYLDIATDLTHITLKPEESETETLEESTKRYEDTLEALEVQSKFYGVSIEAIVNGILRLYIEAYENNPKALEEDIKTFKESSK